VILRKSARSRAAPDGDTIPRLSPVLRGDTTSATSSIGLSNSRTRIVGARTGVLADVVIASVRASRAARSAAGSSWRRIAGVITPLGWSMIVLVPAALVLGHRLGWMEFVVAGYAGIALLAVATLYLIGRSAFEVDLDLVHPRVVVGDQALGEVHVRNPSRLRVFGVKVEIPVGRGLAEIVMPGLRRGGTFEHAFAIPAVRRGVVTVGPVRTVRADPVGLIRRELVWTESSDLFVHPRTIGIPSTSTGFVRDLEGNPTRDLTSSDVSFHALREYLPGDERRFIHWKSSAKTGKYMVRQFEETRRSQLVVALTLASADYSNDDEFEMAVSVTGSLGVRAIRDLRNVSVVVSEKTPEFAKRKVFAIRPLATLSRRRLLDDLTLVEHAPNALGMADVARVAADSVTGISVAFLVCGSTLTASSLRLAASKFPIGVEVIAVVCDPDAAPTMRRVPGLSVLTIGYLEDLQKSLARAAAV